MLGNVFILGDSYSTYEGYMPAGYNPCYGDHIENGTDVCKVEQTWWHRLLIATNSRLVANHSWSGTTICNTGYGGPDAPNSFIRRLDYLIDDGFFEKNQVDTILVFGGQNDDWCNAPIGDLQTGNWTEVDLLQYGPALCYLIYRIKTQLPNIRPIFIINSEMKPEIMAYQRSACAHYGVDCVQLDAIHKMNGHPSVMGMEQISTQILSYLRQNYYERIKNF